MYKYTLMTLLFSVFFGRISYAQQQAITGQWRTPDKDVIEFYSEGPVIAARQVNTETEKDKINNNKIIAKQLRSTQAGIFEGIVIDPKDNKTYKGRFTLNTTGNEL